jgi:quinol monooxygenase YgiN
MFARVTKYKMKADHIDAAKALLEQLKPRILGMPGIIQFVNVMDSDGSGYIVSVVESRDSAEANKDKVAELWSAFIDHLDSPPEPAGGDVIANWTA